MVAMQSWGELQSKVEQEWVVMVKPGTSDQQIAAMCQASKNGCNLVGHPSNGGVPFLQMRGTEAELEEVLNSAPGVATFVEPDQQVSMIPELPCEQSDVFADVDVEVGPGLRTIQVSDVEGDFHIAKRKVSGTWINTGMFT